MKPSKHFLATTSLLVGAFVMAAPLCVKVAPQDGRVKSNVGHQGEELTYRLVNSLLRKRGAVIWWPWEALPWSLEVLNATLGSVVSQSGAAPCETWRTVRPVVRPPQWRDRPTHAEARRRVYAYCGLLAETERPPPFAVRVLERLDDDDASSPGHRRRVALCEDKKLLTTRTPTKNLRRLERRIGDVASFERLAKDAAERAKVDVDFKVVKFSSKDPGSFCEQIRRFVEADVLISIHGAHLVNVPFLRPRSLLFEVLPWAHAKKKHHRRLLLNTDVHYDKLCGERPRGLPFHDEAFCEGRSEAARTCSTKVRDCFPTRVPPCNTTGCACLAHLGDRLLRFFLSSSQSSHNRRRALRDLE
mmetsp:Transcript_16290/g.53061  ORF Transcript_16290/g.53061 Transcript_16290/m.53061 type:complete len:359 (+) Transcript_16290:54-1130(+)